MVTKHQDANSLNQFQFHDTVVEADVKQISLKAKCLFCKDVYILPQTVCLIVKFSYCHSGGCIQHVNPLSFAVLVTTWGLDLPESKKAESLADSLEAHVRAIKEPSEPRDIEVVNNALQA